MGSICLSFLGYGLLEVWAFGVIFNQNNVAENVIGLLSGSDLNFGLRLLISSCSAIAITLTTLVFVLLCRKSDRIRNHGRVAVVATAVSVAGTALIIAGMPWANFIGFVVAGAGNAWLWICWGDIYTVLETESAEMVATGSVLLQALLLVIMFAAPQAVQATLLLLLVPCSTALYLVALRKTGLSVLAPDGGVGRGVLGALNSDRTTASDKGVNCGKGSIAPQFDRGFALRFVVGMGAPIALSYFLLSSEFSIPDLRDGIELVFAIGLLVFALLFLGFLRFTPSFDLASICCVQLALLVGACLAALFGLRATAGCALVLAATLCSQYFILLYCARICREGFGNVVLTFGIGQLINHGCGLLGTLAAGALYTFPMLTTIGFTPTKGCVLCALAFFIAVVIGGRRGQDFKTSDAAPCVLGESQIQEKLLTIAREGHLSARETEVFLLLAKGRSAPFIRDELMVSLNTVSSHIKHIYGKLGVHSRQELLDLVEEAMR